MVSFGASAPVLLGEVAGLDTEMLEFGSSRISLGFRASGALGPRSHAPTCLTCRVKGFCLFTWLHLQAQCRGGDVGGRALTGISLVSVGGNKIGMASA